MAAVGHLAAGLGRLVATLLGLMQTLLATLVFGTFTFHMLAHDHDILHRLAPHASAAAYRVGGGAWGEGEEGGEGEARAQGADEGCVRDSARGLGFRDRARGFRLGGEESKGHPKMVKMLERMRSTVQGAVSLTIAVAARDVFFLLLLFEGVGGGQGGGGGKEGI
jgi:hypothetical protein